MRIFVLLALLCGACAPAPSPFAPGVARGPAADQRAAGYRMMEAGEHELALRAFQRAALAGGLDDRLLAAMGTANLGLGRLGQAEQLLRRASAGEAPPPEILNNLGVVLLERGKTAEAVLVFRQAFATDSGASQVIRDNLAKALAKRDNPDYDARNDNGPQLIRRGTGDVLLVTR